MKFSDLQVWLIRIMWLLTGFVSWLGLDANDNIAGPASIWLEVFLWLLWFFGFLALLVPSAVSLTSIRILAVYWLSLAIGLFSFNFTNLNIFVVILALLQAAILLHSFTGDFFVNSSSYGPERRMLLKPPAAVSFIVLPFVLLVSFSASFLWLVFLYRSQFVLLTLSVLAAVPVLFVSIKIMHQFSKRWIVFVPAGFVLHDHFVLNIPILFKRSEVNSFAPAEIVDLESEQVIDLTVAAAGLALKLDLRQGVDLELRKGRSEEILRTSSLLITPSLPGKVLQQARIRAFTTSRL